MSLLSFKLFFFGKPEVGKSSIIRQFTGKGFHKTYNPTLGIDIISHKIYVDANLNLISDIDHSDKKYIEIDLQIVDSSEERFSEIISNDKFAGKNNGIVMVYDVTRYDTFLYLTHMINKISERYPKSKIPVLIVGNKSDLPNHEITLNDTQQVIDNINKDKSIKLDIIGGIETSAMKNENISDVFYKIVDSIFLNLSYKQRKQMIRMIRA